METENNSENIVEEKKDNLSIMERAQELNRQMNENLERFEKIRAEDLLSGTSTGIKEEPKKKEVSPEEYAKAALQGRILN